MTTFQEARAFLLEHRTDYEAAVKGFRWPDPVPFNWALDWFDAELAGNAESLDRTALWIVDAVEGRHTKLSFAELSRRSNQVANFLREQGLKRGDHLLLLLGNVVPLWETMLAAMKLGVVVIPATTLLTADELRDRLDRGRAKAVVAAQDQVAKFVGLGADDLVRIVVGTATDGWLAYEEAATASETFAPDGLTQADDPMLLYFTSGTTAKPKLVRHSHRSYPVGHLSTMYWLGLQPGDVHLNISSPGWAKHAWSCFFAPWNAGAAWPWVLSAKNMAALRAQAARLRDHVAARPELAPADVAYSLVAHRPSFDIRAAVVGRDRDTLIAGLDALATARPAANFALGQAASSGKIGFLFPGQGSQWLGMGRELLAASAFFAERFEAVCSQLDAHLDRPLREVLFAPSDSLQAALLQQTMYAQPALFAIEVALFHLLQAAGARPDFVLGHSVGALAAVHCAGAMSIEDASRLVAIRGRMMQAAPSGGMMAAIEAREDEMRESLDGRTLPVSIAAINGPSSLVVSGDADAVAEVAAEWERKGRKTSRLRVSHAFHSPHMEPILPEFARAAGSVAISAPRIPIVSDHTGMPISEAELSKPGYWADHIRHTVRFHDALRFLDEAGVTRFFEAGPGSALCAMVRDSLRAASRESAIIIPVLQAKRPEMVSVMLGLAEFHVSGGSVKWSELFVGRGVDLPSYAFQRQRYWLEPANRGVAGAAAAPANRVCDQTSPLELTDAAYLSAGLGEAAGLLELVRANAAAVLGFGTTDEVAPDRELIELGLNSLGALNLAKKLSEVTRLELQPTFLLDYPTCLNIRDYLLTQLNLAGLPVSEAERDDRSAPEAIAPRASPDALTTSFYAAHEGCRLPDMIRLLCEMSTFLPAFDSPPPRIEVSKLMEGSGQPSFICIPSFLPGSGPHQFARFVQALSQARRVCSLTLPGLRQGDLPQSRDAALEALAIAVTEAARGEPYVLVGYSSGGLIANAMFRYLARRAASPAALVMIDTYEHGEQALSMLAEALGEVIERDHAYVAVTSRILLGLGAYARIFGDTRVASVTAPALLLRAQRGLARPGSDDTKLAQMIVHLDTDHFSIIAEHAQQTALAAERWLSKCLPNR